MSVQAEGRFWSGIDVPKTIAGTLAAVSAAVLGSFLGVAGTLIGAALASVISSIGTEVYHRSIDRGAKRLQSAFVIAPAAVGTPSVQATGAAPSDEIPAAGTASPGGIPATGAAHSDQGKEAEATATEVSPVKGLPTRIRWKRVALVAGAFFVLGLGVLTTAEMFAGRSAADVTSGRETGGPTIMFDTDRNDTDRNDAPLPEQSRAPAGPATDAPATTEPGTEPATGDTTPAEPAPTSEGPEATAPPETGTPEQNETGTGTNRDDGTAPQGAGEAGE